MRHSTSLRRSRVTCMSTSRRLNVAAIPQTGVDGFPAYDRRRRHARRSSRLPQLPENDPSKRAAALLPGRSRTFCPQTVTPIRRASSPGDCWSLALRSIVCSTTRKTNKRIGRHQLLGAAFARRRRGIPLATRRMSMARSFVNTRSRRRCEAKQ